MTETLPAIVELFYQYSARPIREARFPASAHGARLVKPLGLWFSADHFEDNWGDWCRSEKFRLESLAWKQRVVLSPRANIRYLRNAADIDAFTEEFGIAIYAGGSEEWIDWPSLMALYDGIVIAPYCWERRVAQGCIWYYPWDCASGCVWRPGAIESYGPPERAMPVSTAFGLKLRKAWRDLTAPIRAYRFRRAWHKMMRGSIDGRKK